MPTVSAGPRPALHVCTLASGSSGNAVLVACDGDVLLVDAGVSGKRVADAAARVGCDMDRVRALVVTHAHGDHIRSAGVLNRRHALPVFLTAGSCEEARGIGKTKAPVETFAPGATFSVAGFTVETVPTPHDSRDSVALVIERGGVRVGVFTDLGYAFEEIGPALADLDAVVLESNHDPVMLRNGPYPPHLQARIRGDGGHIANEESAALLRDHAGERLRAALLAHLSESNNTPARAVETHRAVAGSTLDRFGVALEVAPRHGPSRVLRVGGDDAPTRRAGL